MVISFEVWVRDQRSGSLPTRSSEARRDAFVERRGGARHSRFL
jgi:hypothetical protein